MKSLEFNEDGSNKVSRRYVNYDGDVEIFKKTCYMKKIVIQYTLIP